MDRVLAQGGEVGGVLSLALDAKDHDDIGTLDRVLDSGHHFQFWIAPTTPASQSLGHPSSGRRGAFGFWILFVDQVLEVSRYERTGSGNANCRAELRQQMNVRTRNAAVKYVADDRDVQSFDLLLMLADRHGVEQRLG